MELDMYLVYEMLLKHPELEIRFESAPMIDGLQIRVIDFGKVVQRYIVIKSEDMRNMRGSQPLLDIIKNMVNSVLEEGF